MRSDGHPTHLFIKLVTIAVLALSMTGMVTLAATNRPDIGQAALLQSIEDNSLCVALYQAGIIDADGVLVGNGDQTALLDELESLGYEGIEQIQLAVSIAGDGCQGFVPDTGTSPDTGQTVDNAVCVALYRGEFINADGTPKSPDKTFMEGALTSVGHDPDLADEILGGACEGFDPSGRWIALETCQALYEYTVIGDDGLANTSDVDYIRNILQNFIGVSPDLASDVIADGCKGFMGTPDTDVDTGPPPVPTLSIRECYDLYDKGFLYDDGSSKITDLGTMLWAMGIVDGVNSDHADEIIAGGCRGFMNYEPEPDTDSDTVTAPPPTMAVCSFLYEEGIITFSGLVDSAYDTQLKLWTALDELGLPYDTEDLSDFVWGQGCSGFEYTPTDTDTDSTTDTDTDSGTDTDTDSSVDTDTGSSPDTDTDSTTDTDTGSGTDTDTATSTDTDTTTDVDTSTDVDTTPTTICGIAIASASSGTGDFARYDLTYGTGGSGSQVIVGTDGPDVLDGSSGNDVLCGLGGNDTLIGGSGADIIVGGAGADTIDAGSGSDTIYTDGADNIDPGSGSNSIIPD